MKRSEAGRLKINFCGMYRKKEKMDGRDDERRRGWKEGRGGRKEEVEGRRRWKEGEGGGKEEMEGRRRWKEGRKRWREGRGGGEEEVEGRRVCVVTTACCDVSCALCHFTK